jgi:hypothetical protein
MIGWQPDAYDRQRYGEAQVIEAKCPGLVVVYGWYSREFWAFGTPDGVPLHDKSAAELLAKIHDAERKRPRYELGSPARPYAI